MHRDIDTKLSHLFFTRMIVCWMFSTSLTLSIPLLTLPFSGARDTDFCGLGHSLPLLLVVLGQLKALAEDQRVGGI